MKFLCVSCDEAMKLIEAKPPDHGSLTVVFRCPTCDHEFAMLTNPYETQAVSSLGVQVGPEGDAAKCPFPGVMQELGASPDDASAGFAWTPEAAERLAKIPEFARPMARTGIEKFARERGLVEIDAQVLEQAKGFLGM